MIVDRMSSESDAQLRLAPNVRSWQRNTYNLGLLPVIAVGGSRGKSIVVRMLDAIFTAAHLRTATWTNSGIEVRGRRQQGELGAWSRSLSRIAAGTVDVAIQELDWSMVHAIGLPPGSYPVVALTNIWPDDDNDDAEALRMAMLAGERMVQATHARGLLVGSADDYRLLDLVRRAPTNVVLTARSSELPVLRDRRAASETSVWIEDESMVVGDDRQAVSLGWLREMSSSLGGAARFQSANAMTAAAIAYSIGIDVGIIRQTLQSFENLPELLPASFNVHNTASFTAVVNRLETPGNMRGLLRALNPRRQHRQISVIGDASTLSLEAAFEIGRMLGRAHGAVILHSQTDDDVVEQIRRGIAHNAYPPLFVQVPTERRALNRAFATIQPGDVLLVCPTDDGRAANRAILRRQAD